MDNLYEQLGKSSSSKIAKKLKGRSDLRRIFFDFLSDFRHYLAEYTRESLVETNVSEIPISTNPVKLFNGEYGGMHLVLKNQGLLECYITTADKGGFRLDPGEKEKLWLNKAITAVTISGSTTLGLIRT